MFKARGSDKTVYKRFFILSVYNVEFQLSRVDLEHIPGEIRGFTVGLSELICPWPKCHRHKP